MLTAYKTGEIDTSRFRNKYPRDEIENLANKGQPTNADTLASILKAHCFDESNHNGSNPHRVFKNRHTHETVLIAPHHKNNDPWVNNRNVSKACLKFRDWVREQEEHEALALAIQLEFECAAQATPAEKLNKIRVIDNLPDDMTGHEIDGKWILRHKDHPYIGAHLIEEYMPAYHREGYITSIRERAKIFEAEFAAATEILEIKEEIEDGKRYLVMDPYAVFVEIPDFESEHDRPLVQLNRLIEHVLTMDERQIEAMKQLIQQKKATKAYREKETDAETGIKTIEIMSKSMIQPDYKAWTPIRMSPHGRPFIVEMPVFRDAIFKSLYYCGTGRDLLAGSFVAKELGLKVKTDKVDGKHVMHITHPFYSEIDMTIPDPNHIPSFQDAHELRTSVSFQEIEEMRVQVRKGVINACEALHKKCTEFRENYSHLCETLKEEPYQILSGHPRTLKEGKVETQRFKNKETGTIISLRVIKLRGPATNSYILQFHPDDIKIAAECVKEDNDKVRQLQIDKHLGSGNGIAHVFTETKKTPLSNASAFGNFVRHRSHPALNFPEPSQS